MSVSTEDRLLASYCLPSDTCMTPGGGGGYSIFFRLRRLGPSIYRSPQKQKNQEFHAPQKYLKF